MATFRFDTRGEKSATQHSRSLTVVPKVGSETLKVPGEARHTPQKKKSETVEFSLLNFRQRGMYKTTLIQASLP